MTVKEEFENFYQKLKQISNFEDTKDRLKFETLITQENILHEVLQDPSDEHLAKIELWLSEHKGQIEYFINKYLKH